MTPKRFPDRDEIAAVRADAERLGAGQEAPEKRRLAGRVLARRDMGKLVFEAGESRADLLRVERLGATARAKPGKAV